MGTVDRAARSVISDAGYGHAFIHRTGHGLGMEAHEPPYIYAENDMILTPGMTFTIEPMVNLGKRHVKLLPDDWTVVTKDHSLSAQWEHTNLVTDNGFEGLTMHPDYGL